MPARSSPWIASEAPAIPGVRWPRVAHEAYRVDYGPRWPDGVITLEPPRLGKPFRVRVPQVDADGNELAWRPQPGAPGAAGDVYAVEPPSRRGPSGRARRFLRHLHPVRPRPGGARTKGRSATERDRALWGSNAIRGAGQASRRDAHASRLAPRRGRAARRGAGRARVDVADAASPCPEASKAGLTSSGSPADSSAAGEPP